MVDRGEGGGGGKGRSVGEGGKEGLRRPHGHLKEKGGRGLGST